MRILQINNTHYIKGGADRVYFNTINLLKSKGHNIICFSSKDDSNEHSPYANYFISIKNARKLSFIKKIISSLRYLYNKRAFRNLEFLIKETKPDIAHIHLFYGGLTTSILKVLKKYKIPIVITVHDYRLLCPANAYLNSSNQICEKCNNGFYMQCAINRCLEHNFFYSLILSIEAYIRKYFIKPLHYIDHFIFVSKFSMGKHLAVDKNYGLKSSHIYNFSPSITENIGNYSKDNYLLYFGRLSNEKGIFTLLEAVKTTSYSLIIVGTGPLSKDVELFCKNYKNLSYLGYRKGTELESIIKGASYVIVPSEWYENNPMTVIEAFSFGIPVIGANIGGIPEIVQDGFTGFLFKSRDINDLTATLVKAKNISHNDYFLMSKNAHNFALSNFSSNYHYKKLMDIYLKLLNNERYYNNQQSYSSFR